MSGFAVDWVWTLRRPRHTERLVLAILASHARRDGVCWPGERLIAREAGIDGSSARRTVRRVLRGLERGGEIESRPAVLDGRRITVFRIAWPGRRPIDVDDYEWELERPFTADVPLQGDPPALRLVKPFGARRLELVRGGGFDGGAA